MFSSSKRPNYLKLRTNLRLAINRLKLMEKKKTELALKARKEIADYLQNGKDDRARIRVEHIVREDYLVEAMEIIEMFCDLLLARFGLIEKMKDMDPGLEEPISTVLWAAPRMYTDIPELREVANQLTIKYGKEYNEACRTNMLEKANEQVLHKMALIAPPKKLIESYLVEIAKTYDVPFEPDPTAFEEPQQTSNLIDIGFDGIDTMPPGGGKGGGGGGGFGGSGGGGGGGGMKPLSPEHAYPPPVNPAMSAPSFGGPGYPAGFAPPPAGYAPQAPPPVGFAPQAPGFPPQHPGTDYRPSPPLPNRPPVGGSAPPGSTSIDHEKPPFPASNGAVPGQFSAPPGGGPGAEPPRPPHYDDVFGPRAPGAPPGLPQMPPAGGASQPPGGGLPELPDLPAIPDSLPGLPSVPGDSTAGGGGPGDVDFDDLTRRFEELKKKK